MDITDLEPEKFPAIVIFLRDWKVIHEQKVANVNAYIPALPPECAVLIECADNSTAYFPPSE